MPASSQPALYVNSVNVNNRYSLEVLWKQTEGLFDGAALEPGATLDTFDGKAKIRAHAMAYQARRVVITGRIINRSGWLDKQAAIADLAEVFAGRPAIVRLGTLELECEFGPVRLVDDAYSHLPGYQTWRVEGEAVPGVYISQYHTALGADQGLAVQDDRPDSAAVKFSSNSFTYTNPGTAPCEAVVSLTGTASTTYYLKGEGLRRVPMTTDTNGNATIDEASGFYLKAGANAIRVEDSAGALASGVTAVNFYGTTPRFLGNTATNATTQSATTNRMSEGPMLTVARTGSASYISTAGTLTTATDSTARIGVPLGAYSSTKAGLILEGAATNLLTSNQATAGDTLNATTGFASSGTTVSPGSTLSVETTASNVYQGSKSLKVVTTSAGAGQGVETTAVSAAANTVHAMQLRLKTTVGQQLNVRIRDNTNGSSNTQTITGTGSFETITATLTTGALAVTSLTISVYTATGVAVTFYIDALQIEANPFPTSWVDGTRNGSLCGIVSPHNLLTYSEQFSSWTASNASITSNSRTARDGTTTADTITLSAAYGNVYQDIVATSNTLTFAVDVEAGSLSTLRLRLYDLTASVELISSQLTVPATGIVRVYFTTPVTSGNTYRAGIYPGTYGSSTSGTLYIWGAQVVTGSNPGPYVRTTDTAIAKPADATLDPAWVQNGKLRGYFVLPSGANVAAGTVILGYSGGILITQYASTITLSRASNGGTRSVSITLNAADNARHSFEASWGDYTTSGTRAMPLTLTVDSTTATIDAASLYGDTSWSTPDATKLISGGSVFSTLSAPSDGEMMAYPTLPAGAIPAA